MTLAEDISRQSSIDSVMGFLVVTFMQAHNEMEKVKQGNKIQFEEKRITSKCNGAKFGAPGDKKFE